MHLRQTVFSQSIFVNSFKLRPRQNANLNNINYRAIECYIQSSVDGDSKSLLDFYTRSFYTRASNKTRSLNISLIVYSSGVHITQASK